MASSSNSEPSLSLQSFHQCSSLVPIKLNTENYLIWSSQVQPLIFTLGLNHHIVDVKTPPKMIEQDGKEINNPDFLMWKNNDGLLTTWLRSMMNEDVLSMVISLQTAREIWLTVEENMLPATKEQETWLKDNLYSLKKGSSKLDEFLKKFKGLCDKLAAIGKPTNDDDKIFQIARALGPKYADFKTAMLTKPPYPSLKQFIIALQNHEHTVIVEKDEEARLGTNQNQAFFGQRGRGRNQRGGRPPYRGRGSQRNLGGRNYPNNYNNYNGNNRKPQQQPQKPNKENNTSDEEVICQICHKRKHSAAECWYRYDYDNEEDPQALAAMNLQENNDQQFYVDSGATSHMTNNTGNLDHVRPYRGNDKIIVGNGQDLNISHIGSASLNTNHGSLHLNNILGVPKLKKNLLSVGQLIDDIKCVFEFNTDGFIVKSKENKVLAKGSKQGKLYTLEGDFHAAFNAIQGESSGFSLWHKRLGHANPKILEALKRNNFIDFSSWSKAPRICVSCQLGKSCRKSFNLSNNKADFPLQKVHCDICGPAPITSTQYFRY